MTTDKTDSTDSKGLPQFPSNRFKNFTIVRDNQNLGTYYFKPNNESVIYVVQEQDNPKTVTPDVTVEKIVRSADKTRYTKAFAKFTPLLAADQIRYQHITYEAIGEPSISKINDMID